MEVALTFGSLGDLMSLSQLAIQLGCTVVAVGAALRGDSAREYQQLRHDLDLFINVLMQASYAQCYHTSSFYSIDSINTKTGQVVATYQQHELTPYLQGLDFVSKQVVENCTTLIRNTLHHLQSHYGSSLAKDGPGNKVKDVRKRIEWLIREKERPRALREALKEEMQRLALLSSLAARYNETTYGFFDVIVFLTMKQKVSPR